MKVTTYSSAYLGIRESKLDKLFYYTRCVFFLFLAKP